VAKLAARVPGIDAEALVAIYERRAVRPPELYYAIETDRVFRIPAVRLAEAQRGAGGEVFLYRIDWASPAFGGLFGACHAIELPFVFGTHGLPGAAAFVGGGPPAERFAAVVMDAWLAFARGGDPGWEGYETRRRATQLLGPECALAHDPGADERRAWDGVL
jgi:para-nitrobenzyl esterase